jgi:hypothetical protein
VIISSDGRNWDRHPIPWESGQDFGKTAYGNGIYVAIGGSSPSSLGGSGMFLISTDGITWSRTNIGSEAKLKSIAYGNGIFVAVGGEYPYGHWILTSSDGITWTDRTPDGYPIYGVTFGNDIFVAVSTSILHGFVLGSQILVSQDGINWSSKFNSGGLYSVVYGNGVFAAKGPLRTLITSLDGEHWIQRFIEEISGLYPSRLPMTFGNNTFLVFGENYVLQSDPFFGPGVSSDISVNGTDIFTRIVQGDLLSATINLVPDVYIGTNADWWIVASTPMGWYYYVHPHGWYYATSVEEVQPAYQGPLFHLSPFEVLTMSSSDLFPGSYTVYFGVDLIPNGQVDYESLFLDYAMFYIRDLF